MARGSAATNQFGWISAPTARLLEVSSWVVERFFALINRNRRLARGFEASIASAEAFLYAACAIISLTGHRSFRIRFETDSQAARYRHAASMAGGAAASGQGVAPRSRAAGSGWRCASSGAPTIKAPALRRFVVQRCQFRWRGNQRPKRGAFQAAGNRHAS